MSDLLFSLFVAVGSGALWVIGLCRLNQLDVRTSKLSWLYSYKFAVGLATAMAGELLLPTPKLIGDWWLLPLRGLELLVLVYALYRMLRSTKRWHGATGSHAPPESDKAPLGDR